MNNNNSINSTIIIIPMKVFIAIMSQSDQLLNSNSVPQFFPIIIQISTFLGHFLNSSLI